MKTGGRGLAPRFHGILKIKTGKALLPPHRDQEVSPTRRTDILVPIWHFGRRDIPVPNSRRDIPVPICLSGRRDIPVPI